ncbi:hypothetical protein [Pedobacter sp. GR22-10]|uniref:hypothetical protein n=1 Tax=Pedobacter sp. GR22-10 TaxID=2994472 RepID=UPI0022468386|nr:hypothetical protein [Pedobacter sp. GR22-10]MCX2430163.1 hypothetical protein [Pedobacter sp. GR22-10]
MMKTIPSIPVNHTGTSITNFLSLVLIPGLAAWLYHYLKALFNQEAISIDANIWPLLLLSFTCWLFVVSAAYLMLAILIRKLTARKITFYFQTFNQLTVWQRYVFYVALYALLVYSAIGSLTAIC